ncbi:hypothetical protein [Roseovarius sp. 217 phage 1]|uniref:Uncharacterized protein n=1 Tax=Roseovarius sp. 217 phage 1 TaxID=874471 RepID=E3PZ53_9CAUD|nr:hypothetical protein [Roseovarius sp. 217 phage 1]
MITAEMYEKATGHKPVDDDLERANCRQAGELGHFHCGWNEEENLPRTMTKPFIKKELQP